MPLKGLQKVGQSSYCTQSMQSPLDTQSQGEVTVRLSKGGRIVNGVGTDPDIIAASAKAYLSALNKLHDPESAQSSMLK
jgi:2-isopropylmalate synthase